MALRRAGGSPETPGDGTATPTPSFGRRRWSLRRIGALLATLAAVGAGVVALMPAAAATGNGVGSPSPANVDDHSNKPTSCADLSLAGSVIISPTVSTGGTAAWGGSPASLTVNLAANFKATAIVVIGKTTTGTHYYHNVYSSSWTGPVTITGAKAPTSGSYNTYFVCGSPVVRGEPGDVTPTRTNAGSQLTQSCPSGQTAFFTWQKPNFYDTNAEAASITNTYGKASMTSAKPQSLKVEVNAGYTVKTVKIVAYPLASVNYNTHYYNTYTHDWAGPVTITGLVGPDQPVSGPNDGPVGVIKFFIVCGVASPTAPSVTFTPGCSGSVTVHLSAGGQNVQFAVPGNGTVSVNSGQTKDRNVTGLSAGQTVTVTANVGGPWTSAAYAQPGVCTPPAVTFTADCNNVMIAHLNAGGTDVTFNLPGGGHVSLLAGQTQDANIAATPGNTVTVTANTGGPWTSSAYSVPGVCTPASVTFTPGCGNVVTAHLLAGGTGITFTVGATQVTLGAGQSQDVPVTGVLAGGTVTVTGTGGPWTSGPYVVPGYCTPPSVSFTAGCDGLLTVHLQAGGEDVTFQVPGHSPVSLSAGESDDVDLSDIAAGATVTVTQTGATSGGPWTSSLYNEPGYCTPPSVTFTADCAGLVHVHLQAGGEPVTFMVASNPVSLLAGQSQDVPVSNVAAGGTVTVTQTGATSGGPWTSDDYVQPGACTPPSVTFTAGCAGTIHVLLQAGGEDVAFTVQGGSPIPLAAGESQSVDVPNLTTGDTVTVSQTGATSGGPWTSDTYTQPGTCTPPTVTFTPDCFGLVGVHLTAGGEDTEFTLTDGTPTAAGLPQTIPVTAGQTVNVDVTGLSLGNVITVNATVGGPWTSGPYTPPGTCEPTLPKTGMSLTPFLWGGGALLLAGIAVLLFVSDGRSRRRPTEA